MLQHRRLFVVEIKLKARHIVPEDNGTLASHGGRITGESVAAWGRPMPPRLLWSRLQSGARRVG